eukprot:1272313-Amphidinium_carterae.1
MPGWRKPSQAHCMIVLQYAVPGFALCLGSRLGASDCLIIVFQLVSVKHQANKDLVIPIVQCAKPSTEALCKRTCNKCTSS